MSESSFDDEEIEQEFGNLGGGGRYVSGFQPSGSCPTMT